MTLIESRQPSTEREVEIVVPLEDRRQRIVATLESAAIDIGRELIGAKKDHQGCFLRWVEDELPFGIDKAERLMAITRTFANCDPEMRAALPKAHTTLFELTRLPADRLRRAVESGEVNPSITYREAMALRDVADPPEWEPIEMPPLEPSPASEPRLGADLVAKELMRFPRGQLSDEVTVSLRRWLG